MKKTHKQVVGLVSLGAVAAMTIFAATLPSPGAAATSTVTDTVTLQVIGSTPDVNFTGPENNIIVTSPDVDLGFNYNSVRRVKMSLRHTSEGGVVTNFDDVIDIVSDLSYDTFAAPFDLAPYGYGRFEFILTGEGADGVEDTDAVALGFQWMNSDMTTEEDENPVIEFDYDDENPPEEIKIVVKDPDGEIVYEGTVTPPDHEYEVPFDDIPGLTDGEYTIEVTGYNSEGEAGYTAEYNYEYEAIPVPNTGSFLRDLNVSREDFLVTALIAFFVVSVVGVGVIVRKKR